MEEIVAHQWNFQCVSLSSWRRPSTLGWGKGPCCFLKLVRAVAEITISHHSIIKEMTLLRGLFVGLSFFLFFFFYLAAKSLRVASVQVCNHCHPWPSVITSRLVCWLLPALLFSQLLLTGTWYSGQRPISRSSSLLCFSLFLHLFRTILAALAT